MVARFLRAPALDRTESLIAAAAAALAAALALAGVHKLGSAGLLVPLALAALVILLFRPVLTVCLVVGLTILCEGPSFGLLTFSSHLYDDAYKYVSVLDILVAVAILSVGLDLLVKRRPLLVPRPLRLGLALLALAMVDGVVEGRSGGSSLRYLLASEHVLFYLLLLPLAVANLRLRRAQVTRLLGGAAALAALKAVLGLIEVAGHYGQSIEGTATLTYYEPLANWLILIAILALFGAALARAKPPRWMYLSSPLLLACLLLSYRRSFWVALVVGLALVLVLGSSPAGRRAFAGALALVAVAIWLLGSINFQSQLPIVKRAASLEPSKLEANLEDRYRLDERANVLGEISQHPISGLGMLVPWAATVRPLPVEHEEGRQYVHFAALWFWLKLGVLGLFAYIGVIVGAAVLAWQAWRRSREPLLRAFALASLAGVGGLVAMDTTASFTGVEARFTVLFAAQLGLLALLARTAPAQELDSSDSTAVV
jgi:O-antigen ligase